MTARLRARVVRGAVMALVAAAAIAGCAPVGMTLRSNHYRVYVPPEWQVVTTGGTSSAPTVLRVPAPGVESATAMEIRLYPWEVDAALADPTGDALKRLAEGGVLDLVAAADDEEPCPQRTGGLFMFGRPTRAIHTRVKSGQRVVVTAADQYGSLVAVVGILAPGRSPCDDAQSMDSAIKRLIGAMAGTGDASRPVPAPTTAGVPGWSPPFTPVDPGPLSP